MSLESIRLSTWKNRSDDFTTQAVKEDRLNLGRKQSGVIKAGT